MHFALKFLSLSLTAFSVSCGTETTTTTTTTPATTTTTTGTGIALPGFDYTKSGYSKPTDAVMSCSSTVCRTTFTIQTACKVASVIVMDVRNNTFRGGAIVTEFIVITVGFKLNYDVPISATYKNGVSEPFANNQSITLTQCTLLE
jgi:hypothetical protein